MTMSELRRLGRISLNTRAPVEAPDARAASTNSRFTSVSVCPRTTRARYGQPNTLITTTSRIDRFPDGSDDRIAIMKISDGKAIRKSITREITWSTQPW